MQEGSRYTHWTLDDVPWDQFDPEKVDWEIMPLVRAAGMVEYNGAEYADYLCNVFRDDPEFQEEARRWAKEEVQHGDALGRYAEMVDKNFSFKRAFERFHEGYGFDIDVEESRRGSKCGELIARCVVETGTSSYYTALGDATDEPVLKFICYRIAQDEFRHYKLFYDYMKRYQERERLNALQRFRVGISRVTETEDDELAYAYYAANIDEAEPYDRARAHAAYMAKACSYYRPKDIQRALNMIGKAIGIRPWSGVTRLLTRVLYRKVQKDSITFERRAAA